MARTDLTASAIRCQMERHSGSFQIPRTFLFKHRLICPMHIFPYYRVCCTQRCLHRSQNSSHILPCTLSGGNHLLLVLSLRLFEKNSAQLVLWCNHHLYFRPASHLLRPRWQCLNTREDGNPLVCFFLTAILLAWNFARASELVCARRHSSPATPSASTCSETLLSTVRVQDFVRTVENEKLRA